MGMAHVGSYSLHMYFIREDKFAAPAQECGCVLQTPSKNSKHKSPNFLITPDLPSSDRTVREILLLSTHILFALECFVLVIDNV